MVVLREYNKEDVDFITKLGLNLHDNYKFSLDEFTSCLVCVINKKIVSFVTYSIIYDRCEIVDIYVLEEYRKNKIGTKLIEEIEKKCKLNKCLNITLEVNENNRSAIEFYKQVGFKIETTRKHYYDNNDAYLMKKDLR